MKQLKMYRKANGDCPFEDWLETLDTAFRGWVHNRLDRLKLLGHLGEHRRISAGIIELKFYFGPGYRIYIHEEDTEIVILLCGGDKSSQERDIERAERYLKEYVEKGPVEATTR